MKFEKILPYGPESYTYWISGIYKIVSYRPRSFHAYYIHEGLKNWGDHVETPPEKCRETGNGQWPTLKAAKAACERHAENYEPKPRTVKRAAEILSELREQAKAYSDET